MAIKTLLLCEGKIKFQFPFLLPLKYQEEQGVLSVRPMAIPLPFRACDARVDASSSFTCRTKFFVTSVWRRTVRGEHTRMKLRYSIYITVVWPVECVNIERHCLVVDKLWLS